MTVRPKELPHGSKLIMGLNPPFGLKAMLANKFIDKALTFKPKLIILIVPKEAERLDQKRQPYDLVWEDNQILFGKSFYLPGSLDVSDKQMDQWNASAPPLYLWSHSDWTEKHKKIAEGHGHTGAFKVFSHAKEEVDYHFDDLPTQSHGEVTYEQNSRSGKEKGTHMDENMNFVTGKPEQVDGFPPEKQVAIAYAETKVASNKSDVHREERGAHSDFKIACYNDDRKALEVSNSSKGRRESERTGGGDDAKAVSDMSISPSDSRNSQYKSRSYSFPMPSESECPSERMAHQDNYLNNPVADPCTSPLERAPYEDSYGGNVDAFGVASLENHCSFSTDNVGAGSRMYSPNLEELTGLYAGDPTGNLHSSTSGGTGSSFYRRQNLEDYSVGYSMESADSAQRNLVPGRDVQENARTYGGHIRGDNPKAAMNLPATDIRAQIRMYGGHIRDDHPQTAMNPPATDIRAQIRMYGGQSTYDHLHTSRYSSGSSDARFEESALTSSTHGMPSLGSTGRSVIDKYTPCLDETNYTTGPRGPYNVPNHRRDMPPDPVNFASLEQYTYPRPGSSGGWLG